MSVGILPNVNFTKLKRDAKQVTSVCSCTTRLKNNQVRSPEKASTLKTEKSDDKAAVAIVKAVPQLGCVSQDSEPSRLQQRREAAEKLEAKSFGTNSKSTIHTVYAT